MLYLKYFLGEKTKRLVIRLVAIVEIVKPGIIPGFTVSRICED
jgi:hypothetical protein